jgi:hypothetical protein
MCVAIDCRSENRVAVIQSLGSADLTHSSHVNPANPPMWYILYRYMIWIDLAQDRDQWRALVNTEIKLRIP